MFQNVDNKEFKALFQKPNTVVIDVRTPGEVAERHIPQANLFLDINGGTFEDELDKLDKTKTMRCIAAAEQGLPALVPSWWRVDLQGRFITSPRVSMVGMAKHQIIFLPPENHTVVINAVG